MGEAISDERLDELIQAQIGQLVMKRVTGCSPEVVVCLKELRDRRQRDRAIEIYRLVISDSLAPPSSPVPKFKVGDWVQIVDPESVMFHGKTGRVILVADECSPAFYKVEVDGPNMGLWGCYGIGLRLADDDLKPDVIAEGDGTTGSTQPPPRKS